ncbi:MAG: YigZ family protein [Lachnospiraceae bacterium]|nr:YigZ family protein [Lachnospiraceae bacterium]
MANTETGKREAYRILVQGGEGEIVEKKSRFIATVRCVESEEEALAFIEEMKKKYWDARHNCHAFVVGENGGIQRYSDDGEPGGTAGRPMLDVLLGEGIRNIAVVVTRYFGGVLLGTGGLVRAYTQAVKAGLENSKVAWMRFGKVLDIETDYNGIGKILYLLGQSGIEPQKAEYTEVVRLQVMLPYEIAGKMEKDITEATNGKAQISLAEETYYIDKK